MCNRMYVIIRLSVGLMIGVFAAVHADDDKGNEAEDTPVSKGDSVQDVRRALGEPDSIVGWAEGAKIYFYEDSLWKGRVTINDDAVVFVQEGITNEQAGASALDQMFYPEEKSDSTDKADETGTTEDEQKASATDGSSADADASDEAKTVIIDDFRGEGLSWDVVDWPNSNQAELRIEENEEGKGVLVFVSEEGENKKAAAVGSFDQPHDFSGYSSIMLDIEVGGDSSLPLAIGLWTTRYFETPLNKLKPGMNKNVSFSLTAPTFKSEQVDWENKAKLKAPSEVSEIYLLFYTDEERKASVHQLKALQQE